MARNGSGTYVRIMNWVADASSAIPITASRVDQEAIDIGAALTASIANDGQTPILANLPMSTFRHTGVGNGVAATDYAALGQVQAQGFAWGGTSAGTANAQTITPLPAIAVYAAGQSFRFIAGFTNTSATTLTVSGLTAKAVQLGGAALRGLEVAAGLVYTVLYDGTQFQIIAGCLPFTPNTLINGGFEVWQRGAGGSASIAVAASTASYTADRWYITTGANQASVVSQQSGLLATTGTSARVQRNSGQTGTGAMVFGQPYFTTTLAQFRASKISISGLVSAGANWSPASGNLTISFYVGTGAEAKRGGGFTSETTVVTITVPLTPGGSPQYFSATSAAVVPVSSVQGELQFGWTPVGTAGANDWFSVDDLKVEMNAGPTPYDRQPFGDELARCKRFYQKSFAYGVAPATNVGALDYILAIAGKAGALRNEFIVFYPVEFRIQPGVTLYNPGAANAQARDLIAAVDCSATSVDAQGLKTLTIQTTGNASTAVGNLLGIHYSAEGDL